jgi:phospholipid/cholesterol/gamma-HCH transport system substrate-binding protein
MRRRDEVTVGILVTIAVAVLIYGTLWLARGGLKSGYPLYTRFVWGQNLKQGQPVLLAGVSVGYVGDVNLRRDGYLDVMLRIDDNFSVPKGSFATVKPVGIFGDVAVALTPPKPVPAASYAAGDTVPAGTPTPDIAEILDRVDSIGRATELITRALQVEVVEAGTLKDFQRVLKSLAVTSAEIQQIIVAQNKNLTAAGESFRGAAQHLSNAVDSAKVGEASASVRRASDSFSRLMANIDTTNARLAAVVARIDRGEGSLGKLVRDSTLYDDLRNLLHTGDSLLADLKANPRKYFNLHIF